MAQQPITNFEDWADLSTYPYGLENRVVKGIQVLLQALARRLSTPRGGLFYDLSYGFDIRQFLNARINSATKYELIAGVENEVLQDARVLGGIINLKIFERDRIEFDLDVETLNGPWKGIIVANSDGVQLLPST
jgi:hypothetical protein